MKKCIGYFLLVVFGFVGAVAGSAIAADAPPMPKKWQDVATAQAIEESGALSKRIVDAPIVRSSRGCIGYLGETSSGVIIVRHLLDKKGKPVCLPKYAYSIRTGEREPCLSPPGSPPGVLDMCTYSPDGKVITHSAQSAN